MTYFTHSRPVKGTHDSDVRQPFVLIGSHTCRSKLDAAFKGNVEVSNIGSGTQPLHMVSLMDGHWRNLYCSVIYCRFARQFPHVLRCWHAGHTFWAMDLCLISVSGGLFIFFTKLQALSKQETHFFSSYLRMSPCKPCLSLFFNFCAWWMAVHFQPIKGKKPVINKSIIFVTERAEMNYSMGFVWLRAPYYCCIVARS